MLSQRRHIWCHILSIYKLFFDFMKYKGLFVDDKIVDKKLFLLDISYF